MGLILPGPMVDFLRDGGHPQVVIMAMAAAVETAAAAVVVASEEAITARRLKKMVPLGGTRGCGCARTRTCSPYPFRMEITRGLY